MLPSPRGAAALKRLLRRLSPRYFLAVDPRAILSRLRLVKVDDDFYVAAPEPPPKDSFPYD